LATAQRKAWQPNLHSVCGTKEGDPETCRGSSDQNRRKLGEFWEREPKQVPVAHYCFLQQRVHEALLAIELHEAVDTRQESSAREHSVEQQNALSFSLDTHGQDTDRSKDT
jgi:hypothetical protein